MNEEMEVKLESEQKLVIDGNNPSNNNEPFTIKFEERGESVNSDITVTQLIINMLRHKTTACKITASVFDRYEVSAVLMLDNITDKKSVGKETEEGNGGKKE